MNRLAENFPFLIRHSFQLNREAERVIQSRNGNIFIVGERRRHWEGLCTGGTHELMGGRVLCGYVAIYKWREW